MLKLEHFLCNPVFRENAWLLYEGDAGVLVDPGFTDEREFAPFEDFIRGEGIRLEAILVTHGHYDHIFGVNRCLDTFGDIPVYMHPDDVELIGMAEEMAGPYGGCPALAFDTVDVTDGEVLDLLGRKWTVIGTPGHSKGGVCYYCPSEKLLFSGDTLFAGTIGRTDLHGGSYDQLIVSIMDKLMGLDGDTEVICGHGRPTTIGDERTHNPFLQPWGEKEQDGIDWEEDGIELNNG
jgi:glyoxylase-like metal-dependent hydrolase (beta-lactamase superfamily II)